MDMIGNLTIVGKRLKAVGDADGYVDGMTDQGIQRHCKPSAISWRLFAQINEDVVDLAARCAHEFRFGVLPDRIMHASQRVSQSIA